MRWLLLALCACNQVFGNDRVGAFDARKFDALPDAMPHCPATGTLPVFSPQLHLAIDEYCLSYQEATDRDDAIATCPSMPNTGVYEGPRGKHLELNTSLPVSDGTVEFGNARLSPEGDLIVMSLFDLTTSTTLYQTYTYDPSGWTRGPDLPFPNVHTVSSITRAPDRRILVYETTAIAHELAQGSDGQWTDVRLVTIGNAGLSHAVYLSPDGLRIIVSEGSGTTSTAHTFYADRPDRDTDFSAPVELPAFPPGEVFVTEDCQRLFVSGIEGIYVALAE